MKFFIVVFHFSSRSLQNRSVYYKTLSNCVSRFLDGSGNRMDDWILKTSTINKQRSYPVKLWRRKTWVQRRKESQNRAQNCSGWILQKLYYRRHLDEVIHLTESRWLSEYDRTWWTWLIFQSNSTVHVRHCGNIYNIFYFRSNSALK